ncbi:NADH-dependent flavin oxidoreductase nadA [Paramyrothecium foliicola]|nr:NADH-dependent flavin oxidoreductase nadA [Paramyrothecium foliicola]
MGETLSSWSLDDPSERGIPSDELIELYRRWGEGENSWGVITTGCIDIDFHTLTGAGTTVITPDCPMEGPRFEKFKAWAQAAKCNGSLLIGEVTHPGRQVLADINPKAISASDVYLGKLTSPNSNRRTSIDAACVSTEPRNGKTYGRPRAATKKDIAGVVRRFAYAAEYLEKAGFDGIMLHGAHGYLISQFLSRATNLRTDEYGVQTTENRLRLVSDMAAAIRARVSPSFILAAKLNSVEFQDGGVTVDEAREACGHLETLGFDFVELSGGSTESLGVDLTKESTRRREAYFSEFVKTIVAGFGPNRRIKVFLGGGVRSVAAMVSSLEAVDVVAVGRPAAREPRLADDILSGRVRDGALRPTRALELDMQVSQVVALSQFAQVGAGKEPLDYGDEAVMARFMEDLGRYMDERAKRGVPEPFRVVYSGPEAENSQKVDIPHLIMTESPILMAPPAVPPTSSRPDAAEANRPGRRKACDLCFTKKIKCDMLKPVCSNCKLYKAQCRTSIIRRKANPPRPRPISDAPAQSGTLISSDDVTSHATTSNASRAPSEKQAMEDRLARIERQLQQVLDVAASFGAQSSSSNEASNGPPPPQRERSDNSARSTSRPAVNPGGASSSSTTDSGSSFHASTDGGLNQEPGFYDYNSFEGFEPYGLDTVAVSTDEFAMPPMHELMPVVDHYFTTFNSVVPLFHQQTFMRMINSWFDRPGTRHKASWAAIQIVAAIGMRMPRTGQGDVGHDRITYANCCLRNAQSVVSELVNREDDLLGIQVLLGIVVLFQNSADSRPASVIIATAVRLAHRLQLHSNASRLYFSPEEAEQRSRVFWIAYALDKPASVTPSVQLDADIDIPLPPMAPADGVGLIWTLDGRYHLNYHRQRTELAHISGKVFDLLYSNRAARMRGVERQRTVARLTGMLSNWYERLPAAFYIDNVASTLGSWELLEMTKLLHTYLLAYIMANGLYSHNSQWVRQLSSSGRAAIQDLAIAKGPDGNLRLQEHDAPQPGAWEKCVDLSRSCMKLYQYNVPTDSLIWQSSCAHFSSLVVMLGNLCMHPRHPSAAEDQDLTAKAAHHFDSTFDLFKFPACRGLRAIVQELMEKAQAAVAESQNGPVEDGLTGGDASAGGFMPFPVQLEPFPYLGDIGVNNSGECIFEAILDQDAAQSNVFDVFGMDPVPSSMAPIADVA